MTSSISNALNAYQQALTRIGAKIPAEENAPISSGQSDFQEMVTSAMTNAVDLGKKAEAVSLQGIAGKADIQDVVLAVSNAEMALETVVAVRDTAIKAYKEIMQMPV